MARARTQSRKGKSATMHHDGQTPDLWLGVITLAKVAYALVNEIGFGQQRCFRLDSRLKTFARIAFNLA
jgi:hypothetical protein